MKRITLCLLLCHWTAWLEATYWHVPNAGPRGWTCFQPYSDTQAVMFGGFDFAFVGLNDVHLYDIPTNRWKEVETFGTVPEPRGSTNCFVLNSTLYVSGGETTMVWQERVKFFTDLYSLDLQTLTWSKRSPPHTAHASAASTWVNNMFILFGGQPNTANLTTDAMAPCTNDTLIYDPVHDKWTLLQTTTAPPASCFAAMTAIGDDAYLTGGSPTGPSNVEYFAVDVWRFDTRTLQWTLLPSNGPQPSTRSGHAMVADPAHGLLYIVGGSIYCCLLQDVSAFNLTSGSWTLAATLPVTLVAPGALFAGNTLYIDGGYDVVEVSSTLYAMDTQSSNAITELTAIDDTISTADQRFWYGDALYQSTWFVFGGASGSSSVATHDLLALDMATFAWSPVQQSGAIPPPLMGHSWCVMGDQAILFGGEAAGEAPIYRDTYSFNFTTHHWTYINATGTSMITAVSFHTAVMWGTRMIVFGGVDCCYNYNTVSVLDLSASPPAWSLPVIAGSALPPARRNHNAMLVDNTMWIFGGFPGFADVWSLDLLQWRWTLVVPSGPSPTGRTSAASVLVGSHWYINGGEDSLSNVLSDTWVYDLVRNQWTQMQTLDAGSSAPVPVMNHKGLVSPFGDGLIVWGPGQPKYVTQVLVPGFHNITISPSTGSDALCQLDETQPCQSFAFALSRFAGDSDLEFTVSADLLNQFSVSSSQRIADIQLHVPVLVQGNDCWMEWSHVNVCLGQERTVSCWIARAPPASRSGTCNPIPSRWWTCSCKMDAVYWGVRCRQWIRLYPCSR